MNVHESEKIAGILSGRGLTSTDDEQSCDIIAVNTCCIRETAESKIYGHLGHIKALKQKNPNLLVIVCGCMTQQNDAALKLKKVCPFVDIIIGTHNLHLLNQYIDEYYKNGALINVWEKEGDICEDTPVLRTNGVNAWLNIMYGCDNFCSYCIVPYVRGRQRSRSFDLIVRQVEQLIKQGYKEITLLGQNVNSYNYEGKSFADLINEISKINLKFRLKFMTSHPKDFSVELIEAMAKSPIVSHYIHLPIQSGSDKILQLMNRRYTQAQYLEKIELARKLIPDIGISSDIMVGFPQESQDDFNQTLDVVKKVRYNNLYTFIYSVRKGTPASDMQQIENSIKKERIKTLINLQAQISGEIAKDMIGESYEVLCFEYKNGQCHCKTSNEMLVICKSDRDLIGEFFHVKIIKNRNSNLIGEII